MRRLLGAVVAGVVVACGAFGGTDPAPSAAADAGADSASADARADAALPVTSVVCNGIVPCSGAQPVCCLSGNSGTPPVCGPPSRCPSSGAMLCDDASDCVGAGFPSDTLCCATLRSDGAVILGAACVTASACPANTLELCQPESPATASCTRGASCRTNTTKDPKQYGYCQ